MWSTALGTPGSLQLCATLCYFVLLCATFAYFSPIPTDKNTRLRLTCAPAARDRRQGTSVRCGGYLCGIQLPMPWASCNFVQLLATFAYFCYFCLLFATTHSQKHSSTANLCSSLTRTAPWRLCRVWGWPCGIQLPTPRASCNFVQLCGSLCYFVLLLPTFRQCPQPKALAYS